MRLDGIPEIAQVGLRPEPRAFIASEDTAGDARCSAELILSPPAPRMRKTHSLLGAGGCVGKWCMDPAQDCLEEISSCCESAMQMSVAERILLLEALWDSVAPEPSSVPVPQSHRAELDRRLAAYEKDPGKLLTLEELRQPVEAR